MRQLILILILILGFAVLLSRAYYDTHCIEVNHYQICHSPLGESLRGLKIALLTDLHIRRIDLMEKKILKILDDEKPDLIFLAGDHISFKGSYEPVLSFFHQLKAPHGIYAVFGNTEYSNENGSCVLCHHKGSKTLRKDQRPVFLRNSGLTFSTNHPKVNIAGVDDPVQGKSDLKKALEDLDKRFPTILLAHSPEIFEEGVTHGIDLLLSGHNHGGQIFVTKYLRKIIPLDPTLEFLEGFFAKGKTLMYVGRGVGTSYLPFRLGVKPEITFFEFANDSNKETNEKSKETNSANKDIRITRLNPTARSSVISPHSWVNPIILNRPPKVVFAGFSLTNLVETFNFFRIVPDQFKPSDSHPSNVLFDFESDEELKRLNWECRKWFELSEKNATSGKRSLKVLLPPGQYPGINFERITKNWSKMRFLKMDVFNPSEERITFHIRIDDNKSGWEYANRFDTNFVLQKGMNPLSIPAESIKTNLNPRPLNLKRIERMMIFIPNNSSPRELYIDNIRLE